MIQNKSDYESKLINELCDLFFEMDPNYLNDQNVLSELGFVETHTYNYKKYLIIFDIIDKKFCNAITTKIIINRHICLGTYSDYINYQNGSDDLDCNYFVHALNNIISDPDQYGIIFFSDIVSEDEVSNIEDIVFEIISSWCFDNYKGNREFIDNLSGGAYSNPENKDFVIFGIEFFTDYDKKVFSDQIDDFINTKYSLDIGYLRDAIDLNVLRLLLYSVFSNYLNIIQIEALFNKVDTINGVDLLDNFL